MGDVVALGRDDVDLSDPAACAAAIHAHRPRAVINAAAYTAVDRAEKEEALATPSMVRPPPPWRGPVRHLNIPLVHISTDYVFAGTGTHAWAPDDMTDPQNAYGRSNWRAKQAFAPQAARMQFCAPLGCFPPMAAISSKPCCACQKAATSSALLMTRSADPRPPARLPQRACRSRSSCATIRTKTGTYHFSGAPDVSWCTFAREIFAQAGRSTTFPPITTQDYPTTAARPLNSQLDCQTTEQVFGISRPNWRANLGETIIDLGITT